MNAKVTQKKAWEVINELAFIKKRQGYYLLNLSQLLETQSLINNRQRKNSIITLLTLENQWLIQ